MGISAQFHEQAVFLREKSGSTGIEQTLQKALGVLKLFGIPHFVCGGFAVQEYGYPRMTVNLDIIVPDVAFAREKLSLSGFLANPGSAMTVTDRESKIEVALLPGGAKVDTGPLNLPMPTVVSASPQFLPLELLVSAKLSTFIARGVHRVQDLADVVKLISANNLPRDFAVEPAVRARFEETWDEIHSGRS